MTNYLINSPKTVGQAQDMVEAVPCEVLPLANPEQFRNVDVVLTINVNEIVKTTMDGFIKIVEMMSGSSSNNTVKSNDTVSCNYHSALTPEPYIGIYNDRGYGAYDDAQKLKETLGIIRNYQMQEHSSFAAAADYGRRGHCNLTHVDINSVPALKTPNWFYYPESSVSAGTNRNSFSKFERSIFSNED